LISTRGKKPKKKKKKRKTKKIKKKRKKKKKKKKTPKIWRPKEGSPPGLLVPSDERGLLMRNNTEQGRKTPGLKKGDLLRLLPKKSLSSRAWRVCASGRKRSSAQ